MHLAEASYMSNLETLYLDDNNLTQSAAQYIAYSKYIVKLKVLTLNNNKIGNEGFRYLFESDNFANLKKLMIKYNEISDVIPLTGSKFCQQLEHFDIQENEIRDVGA